MRALLVVNEHASRTDPRRLPGILEQLSPTLNVATEHTLGPGHARELAAGAADRGFQAVLTWGGDGTASEAADGIIDAGHDTVLAALPGGHGNVLCRNLGFPLDPVVAAQMIATAAAAGHVAAIGAGRVIAAGIDRWFVANSGLGPDAAVLHRMQSRRRAGHRVSDAAYLRLAVSELLRHWRIGSAVKLEPGGAATFAIVVNLSPWTYLGDRALDPAPRAGRDDGLALYAARSTSAVTLARVALAALRSSDISDVPGALGRCDLSEVVMSTTQPMWLQTDGEPLAQVTTATYRHRPSAIRIMFGGC